MRTIRIFIAAAALLIVSCSSGEDDAAPESSAAPVTEAEVTTPPTEAAEPEEAPRSDPSDDDASVATEPVDDVDEIEDANDTAESEDPATAEEPLLINGPAAVRPSCASLARGVTEFTLDAGGAVHDVRIYVPETVSSDPAPTVLDWHGLGSNGPEQAALTGYEALAEREGFIVVHATGVDGGLGVNSWELIQFDAPERDDLAFADALIDTVVADWCGDTSRIYSTGMSNGGLFTSELVCNRSTRIAAAASIAGTTHAPTCDPERAVPYIAFHGTADDVVPFDADQPSTLFPSQLIGALIDDTTPTEFGEFAADAGCDLEPMRVEETDEVIRYDYTGCDDDVPMAFYEIVGGGHTWPSSPRSDELADFGFFTQDIDATADAWAFMSRFTL